MILGISLILIGVCGILSSLYYGIVSIYTYLMNLIVIFGGITLIRKRKKQVKVD